MVSVARPLGPADMALLRNQPAIVQAGTSIKRLRDSHHRIARLLAEGHRPSEVSRITGYSLSRVYVLNTDPMFKELVSHYQEVAGEEFRDMQERMANLGQDAVQELHFRLEEDPDKMSNEFLADLVKTIADRTGHAPVSKSVSISGGMDLADRLAKADARVASRLPPPAEKAA